MLHEDTPLDYEDWLARGYSKRASKDMPFKEWFDKLPAEMDKKNREWMKQTEDSRKKAADIKWNKFWDSITPW